MVESITWLTLAVQLVLGSRIGLTGSAAVAAVVGWDWLTRQGMGWGGCTSRGQQQQEGEKLFMLTVSSGGGAVPLQWQGGPPGSLSTGDSDSSAESAGGSGSWEVYYTFC